MIYFLMSYFKSFLYIDNFYKMSRTIIVDSRDKVSGTNTNFTIQFQTATLLFDNLGTSQTNTESYFLIHKITLQGRLFCQLLVGVVIDPYIKFQVIFQHHVILQVYPLIALMLE